MEDAYPKANVEGWQELEAAMRNHPKDAAVAAGADVIVTSNLRDFEILPPGIVAMRPDDFLVKLIETSPAELRRALIQQAAGYSRPAMTVGELIEALRNVAPQFVAKALAEFLGPNRGSDSYRGLEMIVTRRSLMQSAVVSGIAATLPGWVLSATGAPLMRRIPSSGEAIPAIGLGTWITFNVGDDPVLRDESTEVMAAFFEAGGRMIDSSPMYGSSQPVVGYGLERLGRPETLFSAEKVWTSSAAGGGAQIEQSRRLWGVERFDLVQVHNLVAWEAHLQVLFAMKADGLIRYVGITTSEGRRHDLFEQIMRAHPLDFVQLSYNIVDREVEERLLPLAAERGMAVIVNRPFQQGRLTQALDGEPLPDCAAEIGARSWAQFILKFILAHPAVTVAIPATTRVDHVRENMAAAADPLPDAAMRQQMADYVRDL